jgi:hypothetical protein
VKLKLDLHDIYNRGEEIERSLRAIIDEAVAKKAPLVEIIQGKGFGTTQEAGRTVRRPQGDQSASHCVERRTPRISVASSSTSAENNPHLAAASDRRALTEPL